MKHGLSRSAEFIPYDSTTDTDGGMNSALRAMGRRPSHFHRLWRRARTKSNPMNGFSSSHLITQPEPA